MQTGELLQLGRQVILRRRQLSRGRVLLRGRCVLLLLLCLGIGGTLLVGLIVPCLLLGLLFRIFLILVVVDCTGGTGDNGRADRRPGLWAFRPFFFLHHVDLFSFLGSRFRLQLLF